MEMTNRNHIKYICFSEECTFFLNGNVYRQNLQYWSDINPQILSRHTQAVRKSKVYVTQPGRIWELRNRITETYASIHFNLLQKVTNSFLLTMDIYVFSTRWVLPQCDLQVRIFRLWKMDLWKCTN